jgi:ABC-type dipeptide/oligopeptide/nickel transport system ATPase subunit
MLEFDNVSMRYQEVGDVLRNVSFRLTKGEIAFLTGHSGAGKSTLFKLIAMIERGNRGKIMFNTGVRVAVPNKDKTSYSYKWMDATDPTREYNPDVFSEMPNTVTIDEFIPNIRANSINNMATNINIINSVTPPKDVTTTIPSDKKAEYRRVFE